MPEDEKLNELKQITMHNMSKIVKNISNCTKKDIKETLTTAEDLIDYIIRTGDVTKSLYDIQTYDNYTYLHSIDTGIMATFLGISLNFKEYELKELGIGAILHDIGKTKVPKEIITKEGPLTEEEFEEAKKHPIYGEEILKKNLFISDNVLDAVCHHHEKVDGTGYPYGLKGRQISKYAKTVCICDVYDAVSSDRSYRKKFSPNDAYELILAGSGSYFDEEIVMKFRKTFSVYPLGCCLKLSNGIEGYVIKQNDNFPDRPVLRVLYDSITREPVTFYEVDLLKIPNVTVVDVI